MVSRMKYSTRKRGKKKHPCLFFSSDFEHVCCLVTVCTTTNPHTNRAVVATSRARVTKQAGMLSPPHFFFFAPAVNGFPPKANARKKKFHHQPAAGLQLPPETNPADWILDMTTSSQTLPDGKSLAEAYRQRDDKPIGVSPKSGPQKSRRRHSNLLTDGCQGN